MPSKYVKKQDKPIVDASTLAEAIKAVKVGNKKVFAVANNFKIPKTNLYRYVAKVDEEKFDVATATEEQLMEFANACLGVGVKPVCNLYRFCLQHVFLGVAFFISIRFLHQRKRKH